VRVFRTKGDERNGIWFELASGSNAFARRGGEETDAFLSKLGGESRWEQVGGRKENQGQK